MVQEVLFKDISYLLIWWPFYLGEQNHLCNSGIGHFERHFCEIILNLDLWFKRKCCLKLFLIYSSGLFVCFVALRSKSTAMVIAGRSVHLTTLFPGQA